MSAPQENHMWTREHPNRRSKAQIDHILMHKKWASSLRKCRAYSIIEIYSDHHIVTANIKISLRTPRKQSKSSISDFSALRTSAELQQHYSVDISNRFTAFVENISSASIQDRYDKIIEIVDKTNKSVLPKRKHQRENWVSENTNNLLLERKETHRKFRNHRNDHNYLSW